MMMIPPASFSIDPAVGTEKHIRRVDGDEKFREEIRGGANVSLLGLEAMTIGRFLIMIICIA